MGIDNVFMDVGNVLIFSGCSILSDKHDGNILTVPQDLPAYVVMMIVASGPVDLVLLLPTTLHLFTQLAE